MIEKHFPKKIRNNPKIVNYMDIYYDNLNNERQKILTLHNLFVEIYNKFKNKFNEIKNNNYSLVIYSNSPKEIYC